MVEEIVKELGKYTILVVALAWLIRSIITHFLSKDVEKYKEQLRAANDLELEKLRSQLAQQALEHEVKFRRLDEKVADHLTTVYQRLFDLYESVVDYVKIFEWGGEPSKEEKHAVVIKANEEFWDYFLHNRPYVPAKLYKQIREVADVLATTARDFAHGQDREKKGRPAKSADEDHWDKAFKETQEKATPMFSALVAEIQRRLGVVDSE
jgi:hypothetical protein